MSVVFELGWARKKSRTMNQNPEREPRLIREGYLVKKGSMFNTWKPMWVVLSEDAIEFFKKKTDTSPKGMIPLKGSTLTSPCQDFGKRMFVFKLTTTKQQDHFFQASHLEERDVWVKDIKKAIKCILGGQRFSRRSTGKSVKLPKTINLSNLYVSMKDPDKGIREMKLEKDKKIFNHCFTGSCVIDWLLSNNAIQNRQGGLMVASALLNEGYFQAAGEMSKTAAEGLSETPFLDNEDAYYYFDTGYTYLWLDLHWHIIQFKKGNLDSQTGLYANVHGAYVSFQADSGFFCEGNSSDDDGVFKEEFRGVVIKQGCLLKQGHRRKNWKVRKFVLREDPAYMHYYDPAGGEEPLGAIHLRGCVVTAVEDAPDGKKNEVGGNLFEIITANEVHYVLQAATSAERTDWIKAVQMVARTGK